MRLIIVAAILVFGLAGEAAARDANGGTMLNVVSCSYYLDAYSKTTLTGEGTSQGPYEFWGASGWISGYLSGYNVAADNGKGNIVEGMSYNDTYRWAASWCRDNPSEYLFNAVAALISSRLAK